MYSTKLQCRLRNCLSLHFSFDVDRDIPLFFSQNPRNVFISYLLIVYCSILFKKRDGGSIPDGEEGDRIEPALILVLSWFQWSSYLNLVLGWIKFDGFVPGCSDYSDNRRSFWISGIDSRGILFSRGYILPCMDKSLAGGRQYLRPLFFSPRCISLLYCSWTFLYLTLQLISLLLQWQVVSSPCCTSRTVWKLL